MIRVTSRSGRRRRPPYAEQGFGGATISEVERRVGLAVGKGSLYRHFPSKEALLEAAVEREVTRLRAETTQARAELPPVTDPAEQRLQVHEGERVP
ncbi:TetR/AcrR family transcriptional regulator [Streptomyces sp. NPDC101455]|uniref:TetR/AcrR family transcriptional regulator n=1 Tax=Streptomyces sp. NPDC101455 TaxID=3366142 RepID=UPI0037FDC16E